MAAVATRSRNAPPVLISKWVLGVELTVFQAPNSPDGTPLPVHFATMNRVMSLRLSMPLNDDTGSRNSCADERVNWKAGLPLIRLVRKTGRAPLDGATA